MASKAALAGADVVGNGSEKKNEDKKGGTKRKAEEAETKEEQQGALKKGKVGPNGHAVAKEDKEDTKKKESNHQRLERTQSAYYTHALENTEWMVIAPKKGSNVKEAKVWLCVKQTKAEKDAKAPPKIAQIATPLHLYLKPQGPPWGDWKTKNEKLQEKQNKVVPVNAKLRLDVRAHAWDDENRDANNEDPHCAEFLDVVWPKIEHAGNRAFVESGVLQAGDLALYSNGCDEKKEDKTDYIIKNMKKFGKLGSPIYIPVAPKNAETNPGQPLPKFRRLQMVHAVCKPVFDDKRNKIITDDPEMKRVVAELLKYRNPLNQELQIEPYIIRDMQARRLSGKHAVLNSGEVGQDFFKCCYVKNPNTGGYALRCEVTESNKFRKAKLNNADQQRLAEYTAAGIEGADSFDDEDDDNASSTPSSAKMDTSNTEAATTDQFEGSS